MVMVRQIVRLALFAVLVAGVVGCGNGSKVGSTMSDGHKRSVSYDSVSAAAQRYAHHVLDSVDPKASKLTIGPFDENPSVSYCSNSDDPPKGTPINVNFDYKVVGVDRKDVPLYFANFKKMLERDGWKQLYELPKAHALAMGKGGYVLLLQFAPSNGLLSLGVETPCVAPKDPKHPLDVPSGS